jgi:hypothetical protein
MTSTPVTPATAGNQGYYLVGLRIMLHGFDAHRAIPAFAGMTTRQAALSTGNGS